jgi:hypothetical protein
MKTAIYRNAVNQREQWICDDPKKTKYIDGVQYLMVRRPNTEREVLMRKDSLILIKKQ